MSNRDERRAPARGNERAPQRKQIVGAVEWTTADGEKKTHWTRIGVAFPNRDGSWNLLFDYFPRDTSTTIQVRAIDDDKKEGTR